MRLNANKHYQRFRPFITHKFAPHQRDGEDENAVNSRETDASGRQGLRHIRPTRGKNFFQILCQHPLPRSIPGIAPSFQESL